MPTRNTAQYWENALPVWESDKDSLLVCCQIRQETHDVKSFSFKPRTPALFRFLPGQFVTLELNINGEQINRSYTIASSPTQPDTLTITVKRKPDGIVSNWLHDHLQVGSQLSVLGPTGEFSSTLHPAEKYLFLSGGSGITPLMSMSRAYQGLAESQDIAFVHSARSPADIIFRQELELMAASQAQFNTVFVCEHIEPEHEWSQPTGFLNIDTLQSSVPDFLERPVFTCGPGPYMAAVRDMLVKAGFDMQRYHEESFNFDELIADTPVDTAASTQHDALNTGYSVYLSKTDTTIQCAPDQFILDAARAAGLRMPASCSKGLCGTCKSKLVSGQVDMKHGGGIRQREIDQGMFLPCCSKPLGDVVIER